MILTFYKLIQYNGDCHSSSIKDQKKVIYVKFGSAAVPTVVRTPDTVACYTTYLLRPRLHIAGDDLLNVLKRKIDDDLIAFLGDFALSRDFRTS